MYLNAMLSETEMLIILYVMVCFEIWAKVPLHSEDFPNLKYEKKINVHYLSAM